MPALQGVQHDRGPPLSLGWGLGALGGLEGGEGLLGPGEGTWYCREGSSTGWKEWREVGRVVGREVGGGGNSPPPGTSILGLDILTLKGSRDARQGQLGRRKQIIAFR